MYDKCADVQQGAWRPDHVCSIYFFLVTISACIKIQVVDPCLPVCLFVLSWSSPILPLTAFLSEWNFPHAILFLSVLDPKPREIWGYSGNQAVPRMHWGSYPQKHICSGPLSHPLVSFSFPLWCCKLGPVAKVIPECGLVCQQGGPLLMSWVTEKGPSSVRCTWT